MTEKKNETVENYKFEPIKGFPMLQWRGKRPFTATTFYPAQLKESYGSPDKNGWKNKLLWGDNLQVMSHLLKTHRGKIDLIYIDPPFDSKVDYKKTINLKGETTSNDHTAFEEKQYSDIWANDEYLQFMYERLILLKELLSPTGSIYLHCDWHKSHYLRLIMDEIFGQENFRNELIWKRTYAHNDSKKYGVIHDTIFFYTKSSEWKWNVLRTKPNQEYIETFYDQTEESTGRRYARVDLTAAGVTKNGPTGQPWRGINPTLKGRHWSTSPDELEKLDKEGRLHWPKKGVPRLKKYADEFDGITLQDIWDDIRKIHNQSDELLGYPTQKPEELLKRIILASSNEGDLVFDCFLGSGTTASVASTLNRRFICCDINSGAISLTVKRLTKELQNRTGFDVLNVNHYDFFKNEIEARDILISALEVTPFSNKLFDGEKDGRMVKVMPVNRIATRADLNELVNGFDYKTFRKRKDDSPNKPVEKILLICMGHEVDLKANLELAVKEAGFDIDVEVVDILRDKTEIQFKRDSEARVSIKKGKLVIEKFYPMNLLQKLSLQKSKVEDWRELSESVMIDWNYDGAVLSPSIIDIPSKNDIVSGEYEVPKDAGTIRVKITDLLSESLEIEVSNG